MSRRGVPVFNAPGANANAVKELVLAALLIGARNLVPALHFVDALAEGGARSDPAAFERRVEEGKKQFAGIELPRRTLGVVGLGAIGALVAETAMKLGMKVIGFDPEITVDAAWRLHSGVRKAHAIEELLRAADFVTLHVPLLPATRGLIDAKRSRRHEARYGAAQLRARRHRRRGGRGAGAARRPAEVVPVRLPVAGARRRARRRRAAAPRRLDQRGRGELRRDGGRATARLPGERQHRQRGQLPGRGDDARVGVPRRPSPTPTCRTCWARSRPRWPRPA